ncbi:DUF6527 family protein [Sulfuricurvum sp.]|uniref:DUF6527 family protein n=1 Tax=Sulfuricurvum sp. TaxID=2025608 RepID=UPI0026399BC0|nr:DUF6527 family protein [Sulfuricurvum sp.]MDD2267709.1 DUF6527 family protein [Sulfuricurvum sp.]MDD2783308.1 DUF6527 family protein [Sulfuricurvum sp.]
MNHKFVTTIPAAIEEQTLYISIEYKTAIHLCACGCGCEVVTPLSPSGWKMTYNGAVVSLHPSIGNWSLPCKSHYFIINDAIKWANAFDEEQITRTKAIDKRSHETYYGGNSDKQPVMPTHNQDTFIMKIKKVWKNLLG